MSVNILHQMALTIPSSLCTHRYTVRTIAVHFYVDIVYVMKSSLSKYVHGDHMYDMTVEVVSICNLSLIVSMPYSSLLKSSRNVLKWSISLRPAQPYNIVTY